MWLIEIIGNFAPMKKIVNVLFALLMITLTACENEVELSGEFDEVPVIFGLLDISQDTQFVRVSKTFLEEGKSAIELAKDPRNIYYDSLEITLKNLSTNELYTFKEIKIKKEDGLFSNNESKVYYIDTGIVSSDLYDLKVATPTGKIAKAQSRAIGQMSITNPPAFGQSRRPIVFKNEVSYNQYGFEFELTDGIKSFEARLYFIYFEGLEQKEVEVPIGAYTFLEGETEVRINMDGKHFFESIAKAVPPTNSNKVVPNQDYLRIEVIAVDENYEFYREVNGAIENLSQVRPEYSNVQNGLGLFASKSLTVVRTSLNTQGRQELQSGPITGDRNFVYP